MNPAGRGSTKLSDRSGTVPAMNGSDNLMLSGVAAFCADCGGERIFVPVDADCADGPPSDTCEFCCTSCDAAVFLLEVLENTGPAHRRVA